MKFSGHQSRKIEFPPVVDAFPSGKTDFQPGMLLSARTCTHGKFFVDLIHGHLRYPRNANPAGNGTLLLVKSFLREMILKELTLNKVSFLTRGWQFGRGTLKFP